MGKQAQLGLVKTVTPQLGDLAKLRKLIDERRIDFRFQTQFAEGHPSIAELAQVLQAKKNLLPRRLTGPIGWVGGHFGTALLLKRVLPLPFALDQKNRNSIKLNVEDNWYSVACERFVCGLLGTAGLRPLVERHDSEPCYAAHMLGQEYLGNGFSESNFKLPRVAETVHPNRPIGASLFGAEKGGRMDVVCPDVVAFLMLETTSYAEGLGPYLFSAENIERDLPADAIEHLRQSHFSIQPDQTLQQTKDLGYGGVRNISILGERGEPGRVDGRKYMRLAQGRMIDEHDEAGNALTKLDYAILALTREQSSPISVQRGDLLLVNNRRVASLWGNFTTIKRPVSLAQARPIQIGDRYVLRMSFYSPTEIVDHLADKLIPGSPWRVASSMMRFFRTSHRSAQTKQDPSERDPNGR